MENRFKHLSRVLAIVMVVGAAAWGAAVVRLALKTDDGGPPLGVICMAVPAFGLLIGAGAAWTSSNKP